MIQRVEWRLGDTVAGLYEVRGINTEGGMATVYFVWHSAWKIELAIKSPSRALFAESEAREAFVREAETWVNLGLHPNIVTAYYVRELDDHPRLVLEKMNGGSLKTWLARQMVPDLATSLDVAIQIASGVTYAHKRSPDFVHRDLKPANVLMSPDGRAAVSDFGLAGAAKARVGTPAYMAPEAWGSGAVTPAADLYSFGVVLYEMLVGRRPFDRRDLGASLGQVLNGDGIDGTLGALRVPAIRNHSDGTMLSLGIELGRQNVLDPSLGQQTTLNSQHSASADDLAYYRDCHTGRTPPSPLAFNASLPGELVALCLALLSKNSSARPSLQEVVAGLKDCYHLHVGRPYPREEPKEGELVADSLNNRAVSLYDLGKTEDAEHAWSQALANDTLHPEATFNVGLLNWRRGRATDESLLKRVSAMTAIETQRGWPLLSQVMLECGDRNGLLAALDTAAVPEGIADTIREQARSCTDWTVDGPIELNVFKGHSDFAEPIGLIGVNSESRVAVGCGRDGLLRAWNADTGACIKTFTECPGKIEAIVASDDGRWAVTGGRDNLVRVWSVPLGLCRDILEGHQDDVSAVCVSDDSQFILSGSQDRTARFWRVDASTGAATLDRVFHEHDRGVLAVALSRDRLLGFTGGGDRSIRSWELSTGRRVLVMRGHADAISSLAVSDDGRLLLSGSWDHTLRLWDVASGELLRVLDGHLKRVIAVRFLKGGRWAVSLGADRTTRVWEVDTGRCLRTFDTPFEILGTIALRSRNPPSKSGGHSGPDWMASLALTHPRSATASLSQQQRFRDYLDNATERLAAGTLAEAWDLVGKARSLPGYSRAEEALQVAVTLSRRGRKVRPLSAWPRQMQRSHSNTLQCIDFSCDRRYLAVAATEGLNASDGTCLYYLELPSLRPVAKFPTTGTGVNAVCVSRDGNWLLAAHADRKVRQWDIKTQTCRRVFHGHREAVTSLCLSADERWALSGSDDRCLRLWDMRTGRYVREYSAHSDRVLAVCLGGEINIACSAGSDKTIRLWDLVSAAPRLTCQGHSEDITSLCVSRDATVLLSGSRDGTLRLWSIASGNEICTFEGHTLGVTAVALSADGRWAFSAGGDMTIRVWDVSTRDEAFVLIGHERPIHALSLSRDGYWLASGSDEGVVRLWEIDWELEFPKNVGVDDSVRRHLKQFLTRQTPYLDADSRTPNGLIKGTIPSWSARDFDEWAEHLSDCGLGWLPRDVILEHLKALS